MSEIIVTIHYAFVPLLVIALTWIVIRRDYADRSDGAHVDERGER